MGVTLALIIGFGIAVYGLLIMLDPTRLAWLDPGAKAYYQRTLVQDAIGRYQFRTLGLILSFFGWVILSAGLSGVVRVKMLGSISDGFLVLLWLSFIIAFVFGMVYSIYQVVRGQGKEILFGALKMRRRFIALGPIDFDAATILQMQKETKIFTAIYFILIGVCILVSLMLG